MEPPKDETGDPQRANFCKRRIRTCANGTITKKPAKQAEAPLLFLKIENILGSLYEFIFYTLYEAFEAFLFKQKLFLLLKEGI